MHTKFVSALDVLNEIKLDKIRQRGKYLYVDESAIDRNKRVRDFTEDRPIVSRERHTLISCSTSLSLSLSLFTLSNEPRAHEAQIHE